RPAVDVGISVSRVGGDAQVKSMKSVSGTLKLELAQYRSLEAFAMFASDLDPASRQQLTRGARLMELLKQPQLTPYSVEDQVVSIWAGTKGYFDDVAIEDVHRFESGLHDFLRRNTAVMTELESTGRLDENLEEALKEGTLKFKESFMGTEAPETDEGPAADGADV